MAKFQTRVAGVTYYNVNFASIRKSSRVEVVPEPNCRYDKYALRVIIDGNHVGYIKRGFNRTIVEEMKAGANVTARVKAVIGGDAGKNHGIVLNLVVDGGHTSARSGNNLGPVAKSSSLELKIIRSDLPHIPKDDIENVWVDFYEYKKKLPPVVELPKEPNYKEDFDRDVPFLTRLWSESFDSYRARRRQEWLSACANPKSQNEKRERLVKQLNAKRASMQKEFESYAYDARVAKILIAIRASLPNVTRQIRSSNFLTVYERVVYDHLSPQLKNTYPQAIIDGSSIDILCISDDLSSVWAIEIDGGIHRREGKIKTDRAVERKLKQLGVSLIRIPNYMVTRDQERCVKQILSAIETKPNQIRASAKSNIDSFLDSL